MDNQNITDPIKRFEEKLRSALIGVPQIMGNEALNFALDNFKKGGFQDSVFQKWRARKDPNAWGKVKNPGRALLVGSTSNLRRSGHVAFMNAEQVALVWPVSYAKAHNEGISGLGVIQKVEPFSRTIKGKTQEVNAHTRRINMKLPKRQFIGESTVLRARVNRHAMAHIMKHLK